MRNEAVGPDQNNVSLRDAAEHFSKLKNRSAAWRALAGACSIAAILLATGCVKVSETTPSLPRTTTVRTSNNPRNQPTTDRSLSPDVLAATDPCAMRMHDLIGPFLQYYIVHRQTPPRLEDLAALADFDVQLTFVCPASGKPYGYAPTGLVNTTLSRRLFVYDSTPAHDGNRWCIVDDSKPNQAIVLKVIALSEAEFHTYMAAP